MRMKGELGTRQITLGAGYAHLEHCSPWPLQVKLIFLFYAPSANLDEHFVFELKKEITTNISFEVYA